MKFHKLLIVLLVVSVQGFGQTKITHRLKHGGNEELVLSSNPTVAELGEAVNLSVYAFDTVNYSNGAISSVSWAPASLVSSPYSENTTANIKVTTTFTVTATTPSGVITGTITVPIGCSLMGWTNVTGYYCAADEGTANERVAYGVPPYSYLWNNGQTTSSISGLNGGQYIVTVTDSNGCFTKDTAVVAVDTGKWIPTATTIEKGDSAELLAYYYGDNSATFYWAPSSSITYQYGYIPWAHPTVTTTYTVTATGPCGVWTDTVTVFVGCPKNMNNLGVLTTPYFCPAQGGSASTYIYGGFAPFTYAWSTGQTTSSITGLAVGGYSVTVTDSEGCTFSGPFGIGKSDVFIIHYPIYNIPIEPSDSVELDDGVMVSTSSGYEGYYGNDSNISFRAYPF